MIVLNDGLHLAYIYIVTIRQLVIILIKQSQYYFIEQSTYGYIGFTIRIILIGS